MSKKASFCPTNPDLWLEQHRQFRRLVRQRLTAAEMATRLNLPIAEVERRLEYYWPRKTKWTKKN